MHITSALLMIVWDEQWVANRRLAMNNRLCKSIRATLSTFNVGWGRGGGLLVDRRMMQLSKKLTQFYVLAVYFLVFILVILLFMYSHSHTSENSHKMCELSRILLLL